jgi:replicative DNA helicase
MKKQQIDKSNFGYIGIEFQYKLTKYFVEESNFFEDISSIVDPNAFTDPILRKFVGTLKDKYTENSIVPSYEMMGIILKSNAKTSTDIEECDSLIKKLKFETSYEGVVEVKDKAIRFFKQQNLIKVANKILDIAGKGDIERYEECQKLMDDAAIVGQEDDFGFGIYDMKDKALSNDYTVSIPTGIIQLDNVLGGGLDKGKLGLIIAPAGFGKTSFTTAIDAYASTYKCDMNNNQGFKVLQIYFEDDDVDITRKHFSKITQTEARFMKRMDAATRDDIETLLNNFEDKELISKNLRLKHFKTGTKSASDIEIFVKRLINSGFKPDLISIDYFECLAPEKGGYSSDTEWTREGVTMRKLENMAHDLDCAIWIPTQGTKDSMNSPEVVRMDQASGSAKKVHVAQLILSIARAIDDIDKNKAVISILKNRSGKSGKIFQNVKFNNGTCTISCDEIEEFDDTLVWKEESEKIKEDYQHKLLLNVAKKCRRNDEIQSETNNGNFIGYVNK